MNLTEEEEWLSLHRNEEERALLQMKTVKSSGEDDTVIEMVNSGGKPCKRECQRVIKPSDGIRNSIAAN